MCSTAYTLVAALFSHAEKCDGEGCAAGCGMLTFARLLDAPTAWSFDQRIAAREDAFLRGEISA